jgi:hypothetical protein
VVRNHHQRMPLAFTLLFSGSENRPGLGLGDQSVFDETVNDIVQVKQSLSEFGLFTGYLHAWPRLT